MSNKIVDALGVNLLKILSAGQALVNLVDSSGTEKGTTSNPLSVSSPYSVALKNSLGTYECASFRIVGVAATSQVLATIKNTGTNKVAIRRAAVDINYSAAAADLVQAYFRLWINTGINPTGGTAASLYPTDSTMPASSSTTVLFASSADGVASAITHAIPGGNPLREQGKGNILTAVGAAFNVNDYELQTFSQQPLILNPGEVAALILVGNAVDIVSHHYSVKFIIEETT